MAGALVIPQAGTIPGLTVNSTPTHDLLGNPTNTGNLFNYQPSNMFGPPQAYADTNTSLNPNQAFSSGGLTINSVPGGAPAGPPAPSGGGSGGGTPQSSYDSRLSAWRAAGNTGDLPVGWQPTSGSGTPDLQSQLDAIYNPAMNMYQNWAQNVLPANNAQNQQFVTNAYNSQVGLLPGEQQQLMQPIQQNQQQFAQTMQSALDQANRQYQAWSQQAGSMGQGSSVGGALNDLGYQALAQGQQQLSNQQANANLQFSGQQAQVGQFIAQKKADLDTWKNQAMTTIQNNFTNQLAQVQQDETLTAQARQQASLDILQNTINQNQAVNLADQKFQQDLQLFQNISNPGGIDQSMPNAQAMYTLGNQTVQDINSGMQPIGLNMSNTGQYGSTAQAQGGFSVPNFDINSIVGGVGGNPNQQQQNGIPQIPGLTG